MIIFKDGVDEREFELLDRRLAKIVEVMETVAWVMNRVPLVVTSVARDDSSTHRNPPPFRFIDIALLSFGDSEALRVAVNRLFPRDDGRDTIVQLRHGSAPHFHVQVRP